MPRSHILFVTGKLAEPALRRQLAALAPQAGFDYSVAVMPITVVALATTPWLARHLTPSAGIDKIIVPGLCNGELEPITAIAGIPTERGPNDLRQLPEFFGSHGTLPPDLTSFDIQILAEINHAPRLARTELLDAARRAMHSGADLIDVGCDPGPAWTGVSDAVRAVRDEGIRVSIDSFNPHEVEAAISAGAELVLSVNRSNLSAARGWGCEVVAIPDVPATLEGLDETVQTLDAWGVPFRIDPVIEPIGFGFAASLGRYLEVRRRYPAAELLMGIGNLTELTDVDSAGINVMLLGLCQEIGVRSVLTTEVINWCRSCVREIDLARRLVYHAVREQVLPKHVVPDLVMLRDPKLHQTDESTLRELAARITDRNIRLFAEQGKLYALSGRMFVEADDPFELFEKMRQHDEFDPAHAFYLGYELAKAVTALTLGKNYVQDQPLRWGLLTMPERSHYNQRLSERTNDA